MIIRGMRVCSLSHFKLAVAWVNLILLVDKQEILLFTRDYWEVLRVKLKNGM